MYGYEILHDNISDKMIQNVRRGTSQHAYIFEGERGIGSLESARLFANTLVCEKISVAPCGSCSACIMAKAGTHPDIHIITPKNDKKNILVEQIRELSKDAYTKPYENGKKIYIIKYGDEMNEQAQNALLKLLEEPPEYAVFIILAENIETLLPTIRSRCEKINFPPVSKDKIKELIKRQFPEAPNAEFISRYAGGNIEKAKKICTQPDFMPLRQGAFEMLSKLLSSDIQESYDVLDFVQSNKDRAELILNIWQDFLRDIMLIQNDGENYVVNIDFYDKLSGLSGRYDEVKTVNALTEILTAQEMQRRYVSLNTLILRLAFKIKKGDVVNEQIF